MKAEGGNFEEGCSIQIVVGRPSEALNSRDALGFWQKALAVENGWVGVGSGCRWWGAGVGRLLGCSWQAVRRMWTKSEMDEEPGLRNIPEVY